MTLFDYPDTMFVDLRDSSEFPCDGKIPGAVHVTRGMLEFALDPTLPYRNPAFSSGKRVLFYRASGGRSALPADTAPLRTKRSKRSGLVRDGTPIQINP
jgi:rhodanese-related sulfurtransferase